MAGSATADQNEEAKRSVLGRAFEILDCFEGGQEMTVSGICEQTGLPPATVHRMLAALVEWEGVERLARGRYRLGARIWRLGVSAPQVRRLRELAQPYLVNLHMATRGTVYLGVRDGQDAVFGDRITRVKPTAASSFVTRRMPLQSTAGGRVLLAYSDDAWQQVQRNAALAAGAYTTPLSDDDGDAHSGDGLTPYPGGLAALERELAAIRAQGYGVIRDDGLPGRTSVAAPVFGELGTAVASLTVSFPETRIPEPRTILPHVLGTARAISADLSRHSLPASAAGPGESAP